jgi:hypothetical protein
VPMDGLPESVVGVGAHIHACVLVLHPNLRSIRRRTSQHKW